MPNDLRDLQETGKNKMRHPDEIRVEEEMLRRKMGRVSCKRPRSGSALSPRFRKCVACGERCDAGYLNENGFCPNCA